VRYSILCALATLTWGCVLEFSSEPIAEPWQLDERVPDTTPPNVYRLSEAELVRNYKLDDPSMSHTEIPMLPLPEELQTAEIQSLMIPYEELMVDESSKDERTWFAVIPASGFTNETELVFQIPRWGEADTFAPLARYEAEIGETHVVVYVRNSARGSIGIKIQSEYLIAPLMTSCFQPEIRRDGRTFSIPNVCRREADPFFSSDDRESYQYWWN